MGGRVVRTSFFSGIHGITRVSLQHKFTNFIRHKSPGANAVNASGGALKSGYKYCWLKQVYVSRPVATEFLNVAKDDVLAFLNVVHGTYPAPTAAAIPTAVAPFVRKSLETNNTLLRIFNDRLGLLEGELDRLHTLEEPSGSGARVVKVPPIPGNARQQYDRFVVPIRHFAKQARRFTSDASRSMTFTATQPLPGYAICNIGDALLIFSGGVLQFGLHRGPSRLHSS
ncbi:hypothetical protein HD554DRAFT_2117146 [Boletus coccyginus]|nr:hypothetical protein HD554DRAFT_2117146 [Boletus coccyginus]